MPPSSAIAAVLLGLALSTATACGDDEMPRPDTSVVPDATPDAPVPDTAPPGPLAVRLEGPAAAFVDQEHCITAAHNGGADARLTFVWGDDSTDETEADTACHVFAFPGERLVSVVVEARGMRADASRVVPVVFQPAALPPTASSPIAYDAARDRVWVVNPDADTVSVLAADPP